MMVTYLSMILLIINIITDGTYSLTSGAAVIAIQAFTKKEDYTQFMDETRNYLN